MTASTAQVQTGGTPGRRQTYCQGLICQDCFALLNRMYKSRADLELAGQPHKWGHMGRQNVDFQGRPDMHCGGLIQAAGLPEPVPDTSVVDDPGEEPHSCDPPDGKHDLHHSFDPQQDMNLFKSDAVYLHQQTCAVHGCQRNFQVWTCCPCAGLGWCCSIGLHDPC